MCPLDVAMPDVVLQANRFAAAEQVSRGNLYGASLLSCMIVSSSSFNITRFGTLVA